MPDDIAGGVLVPLSLAALTVAPLSGIVVAWLRFDRKRPS